LSNLSSDNTQHPNISLRPPAGSVPDDPGVYRYLDGNGRVLYVGKAARLSSRVFSYFTDVNSLHPRTARMLAEAVSLDWTVCANESEALVLEQRWIRAEQPRFNVALRDGDGYAGLVIDTIGVAKMRPWWRRPGQGVSFGPYPGVDPRSVMETLGRSFGLRSCNESTYRNANKRGVACLLGETGRCGAPCIGRESEADHRNRAKEVIEFLSGRDRSVLDRLDAEMREAAVSQQFEVAARRRDELEGLRQVLIPQTALIANRDLDAVAVSIVEGTAGVAVVKIRGGEVRAVIRRYTGSDPSLSLDEQLAQLQLAALSDMDEVAALILTHNPSKVLQGAISSLRGITVKLRTPRGAAEKRVLELADRNANEALTGAEHRRDLSVDNRDAALAALGAALKIDRPRRIECIDISHTLGAEAVASLVVMVDGVMQPNEYRRIKVPARIGGDDYASIAYAVTKRVKGLGLKDFPNLLVIDGGSGQVGAAASVLNGIPLSADSNPAYTHQSTKLIGLAKRLEEIWLPGIADPVLLSREDPALRVVQLVRDEAHRYALMHHRRMRSREALRTRLDDIPGLGAARRRALMKRFGSFDAVAKADLSELSKTTGIGEELARRIWDQYHPDA